MTDRVSQRDAQNNIVNGEMERDEEIIMNTENHKVTEE